MFCFYIVFLKYSNLGIYFDGNFKEVVWQLLTMVNDRWSYSEPTQASKMELFMKQVND